MRSQYRRTRLALAALTAAAALLLGGCTAAAPPAPQPTPTPTPTKTLTASEREAPTVAKAKLASDQYDYDGALTLLRPLVSSEAVHLVAAVEQQRTAAKQWPNNATVSHLFFHSLIVDPPLAFNGAAKATGYDDYMVTKTEFERVLQSLYERGFVLVSPHDLAGQGSGQRMAYRPILLPPGKTPIVLSQDDVNYYRYQTGNGFAANLTLQDGRVVSTYLDRSGNTLHGAYDMVPIVDDFVAKHPEFAYHGHKGVLALTGYEGVLGYRTSPTTEAGNRNRAADIAQATRVADALKATGWEFASHSWGHINDTKSSVGALEQDSSRWDAEVKPIVGPTDLYVYPFGADISNVVPYSGAKYDLLRRHGFSFFFGVDGSTPHWQQLHGAYLRQARINIDGIRLRGAISRGQTVLNGFFDARAVFDTARPRR